MKIVEKRVLADVEKRRITEIKIFSPIIAQKVKPGQFVVVMVSKEGERIPLTVVDADKDTIRLIFEEVGLTTKLLGKLSIGDSLYALLGPLGHPTKIKNYKKIIVVAGGIGIALAYPVISAFREKNNDITAILGCRTKKLLILEKEIKDLSGEVFITTDDGSYGKKCFVSSVLEEILTFNSNFKIYNLVYVVGPVLMMQKVSEITKKFNIKTIASLNTIMVDATGMCGCCRVSFKGETKFSCIDGPEFDAHFIDWQELYRRNNIYKDKERHICKLLLKEF